jgi:dynein heavy chain
VQVEDAITEALENDNLQLQNMSGQKYVQLNPMFLDAVANWQKKLGTVDSVLATWMDVQKKWQALESIFVGSADIRVQLPDDSKRFDVINADYQVRVWTNWCMHRTASCCYKHPCLLLFVCHSNA